MTLLHLGLHTALQFWAANAEQRRPRLIYHPVVSRSELGGVTHCGFVRIGLSLAALLARQPFREIPTSALLTLKAPARAPDPRSWWLVVVKVPQGPPSQKLGWSYFYPCPLDSALL